MELRKINLLAVTLALLVSCSDDDTTGKSFQPDDSRTTLVKFEMNANTGHYPAPQTRGITLPLIQKENFRILAFKKSADEKYLYLQDVPTDEMSMDDKLLSGTARLPIGEYKFVTTYGLAQSGGFALSDLVPMTTELTDDLSITHESVDGSSVIFLQQGELGALQSYQLGFQPENAETVSASLTRAVARVDVLFLQSKKNGDSYTEVTDSADVFGASGLAGIEMQLTGVNKNINLLGTQITNDKGSLFDAKFQIPNLDAAVTRGTSNNATKVGNPEFLNYDLITGEDIMRGSAHVHGAYLLPFKDAESRAGFRMVLTNGQGLRRTIVASENIPLERNKVTLIKIHVLGGTVFSSNVQFDITVDTQWLPADVVDGEIN